MKDKNKRAFLVYLFILLALLLISVELLLNYFGKSLCQAKACEIVSNLLVIPKIYLLILTLAYFILLFILTKAYLYTEGSFFLNLLFFLIITGVSGDGLLLSKLLFEYKLICYFCLAVSLILFLTTLSYLYLFRHIKFNTSSIFFIILGVLFGIFFIFKIATPEPISLFTSKNNLFLIYAEDCPRCKELLSKNNHNQIIPIPYYKVYPLFKIFDFKKVPLLIEKQNHTWIIYASPEDIEAKLFKNKESSMNIPCDKETQGGLCVLP
ncbi:MAG: hypothetical protein ACP5KO_01200 [Caldimicrobium sp.]